jgi:hypothetical protein
LSLPFSLPLSFFGLFGFFFSGTAITRNSSSPALR